MPAEHKETCAMMNYEDTAAGVAFRLRQLADMIESETSDHLAATLAATWGDTTHGVMELLQAAEAARARKFYQDEAADQT